MPSLLDQVGWNAPTVEPFAHLPNGRGLHRWPTRYLTDEVRAFVPLHDLHRTGLPLLDGPVLGWPAWLVDALRVMSDEVAMRDRQEVARG